jgi:hypothetical protein
VQRCVDHCLSFSTLSFGHCKKKQEKGKTIQGPKDKIENDKL